MVIGFWKRTDKFGFCSNWYPAEIIIDNKTFCCCEQYMMYQKAVIFNDLEVANKILSTTDPVEIKALGRQVKNFNTSIWNKYKEAVVGKAVMAKFVQHPELYKKLLLSEDNILAETSPSDRIWGIGMTSDNPRAQDPSQWAGTNLLGNIVMQIRELLKNNITEYTKINH